MVTWSYKQINSFLSKLFIVGVFVIAAELEPEYQVFENQYELYIPCTRWVQLTTFNRPLLT